MSLAEALEGAASALPSLGDSIRPANGDPSRVLAALRPADRVAVLTWLFSHEPDAGAELASAWCEEEAGVQAVFGVEETALAKAGRKALRRVVHGLRARGIAPAPPPPRKVVATLPRVEEEIEAAFLSSIDPSGARAAYLVESAAGAGARLFEMVLDEERGVVEFSAYTATRGEARRFVRTALAREGSPATEVAADSLRALLARIAAGQPPDRAFPRAFAEWRSASRPMPPTPGLPGNSRGRSLESRPRKPGSVQPSSWPPANWDLGLHPFRSFGRWPRTCKKRSRVDSSFQAPSGAIEAKPPFRRRSPWSSTRCEPNARRRASRRRPTYCGRGGGRMTPGRVSRRRVACGRVRRWTSLWRGPCSRRPLARSSRSFARKKSPHSS